MRILDLFSGEGGAAKGYADAGFTVVGVDLDPAKGKRYPYEFHCDDALNFLCSWGECFDAIHASPPCQNYSVSRHLSNGSHPSLVSVLRMHLKQLGKPYVIENVPGARLYNAIELCGTSFGLEADCQDGYHRQMWRHRLFETSFECPVPPHGTHGPLVASIYGSGGGGHHRHGYKATKQDAERLTGINWMTKRGLSQSIPPAYTKWIGRYLMNHLESR